MQVPLGVALASALHRLPLRCSLGTLALVASGVFAVQRDARRALGGNLGRRGGSKGRKAVPGPRGRGQWRPPPLSKRYSTLEGGGQHSFEEDGETTPGGTARAGGGGEIGSPYRRPGSSQSHSPLQVKPIFSFPHTHRGPHRGFPDLLNMHRVTP